MKQIMDLPGATDRTKALDIAVRRGIIRLGSVVRP
jgi:hypothetical protein